MQVWNGVEYGLFSNTIVNASDHRQVMFNQMCVKEVLFVVDQLLLVAQLKVTQTYPLVGLWLFDFLEKPKICKPVITEPVVSTEPCVINEPNVTKEPIVINEEYVADPSVCTPIMVDSVF